MLSFPITPREQVESEILVFSVLQHICTSQRHETIYYIEHEKGACGGVILVDMTCFLICEMSVLS